jgi:hypothetical protein
MLIRPKLELPEPSLGQAWIDPHGGAEDLGRNRRRLACAEQRRGNDVAVSWQDAGVERGEQ